MKYAPILFLLASCGINKDPGFDVTAQVHRHSIDTNKGIMIQVFPIDKEGHKE